MDQGTRGVPRRDIRVSDAERDQAVAELSEHFQSGRLTQEEFEDRSGRALQARTESDLVGLFNDLPHNAIPAPTPAAPDMRPRVPAHLPLIRVVILAVIAAIVAGNVFGDTTHYGGQTHFHGSLGFLVPVIILGLIFFRLAARRR
jgi:Domain of unknown function (DUF1707)